MIYEPRDLTKEEEQQLADEERMVMQLANISREQQHEDYMEFISDQQTKYGEPL